MKKFTQYLLLGTWVSMIFSSCTVEKRLHSSGYFIDWHVDKKKRNESGALHKVYAEKTTNRLRDKVETTVSASLMKSNLLVTADKTTPEIELTNSNELVNKKILFVEELPKSYEKKSATIQLVIDIKQGFKDLRKLPSPSNEAVHRKRTEGFAIAGFVAGVVGWFMTPEVALLMVVLAIVFGFISLSNIHNNPGEYKGKGLAIAALVLGLVGAALVLFAMAMA